MQKLKSEKPNLKKHWNTGHCIMQRKYIASSAEWDWAEYMHQKQIKRQK